MKKICYIDGCENLTQTAGLCQHHYNQLCYQRKKDGRNGSCSVEGCKKPVHIKGLCTRHYNQTIRVGEILGNPTRGKNDPNEIIIKGEVAELILADAWGVEVERVLIDTEDVSKIKDRVWHTDHNYVKSDSFGEKRYLARLLLGMSEDDENEPDHKNRNPFDNRKQNLRIATRPQNMSNKGRRYKKSKILFLGVSWYPTTKKYVAQISHCNKKIHIGSFNTPEEAAIAYDSLAVVLKGEFAVTNKQLIELEKLEKERKVL